MTSREFLESDKMLLRPWLPSDADALAELASDPEVARATHLPAHPSRRVLLDTLEDLEGEPEVFAIVLRGDGQPLTPNGCIALRIGGLSGLDIDETEALVDYWAGPALRESGLLPEAIRLMNQYAFRDLELDAVWSAGSGPAGTRQLTRTEWETANKADSTEPGFVAQQQSEADALDASIARIAYVRTGGQTGADRGALDAARGAGVPICGWCPKGGLAEDLPVAPGLLATYPELRECPTDSYVERTAWNVRDSHATLIVAPASLEPKSGTEMTARFAISYGRPLLVVSGADDLQRVRTWLAGIGRGITLNVAGPRESKLPGVYQTTRTLVAQLLAGQDLA